MAARWRSCRRGVRGERRYPVPRRSGEQLRSSPNHADGAHHEGDGHPGGGRDGRADRAACSHDDAAGGTAEKVARHLVLEVRGNRARVRPYALGPIPRRLISSRVATHAPEKDEPMLRVTAFAVVGLALAAATPAVPAPEKLDRTVLPIAEPKPRTYSELDARKATAPARFEVRAPNGAPNVVIVLIDDVGFGGAGTFGGPIRTPTMDQLAQSGLRFNNFHTTALCSPTRNALKTGRNPHPVNSGSIMESSTAFPGNTGRNPNSVAPLAEMLRLNGYSTAAFGKWHETAAWETSVSGPFDRWPLHQGFDKFYGFIGGETDQWHPLIYDGMIKIDPPKMANYHFTVDMTNQAINWVKAQQSMTPDKPFFVYFATGATHAPHHVPKEWADKYKGQYDKGWDAVRAETLERQKKLGVVPEGTQLAPRPKDLKAWDALSADEKRLFARQAEVFSGFLEQTDSEIGRFEKALEDIG